MKTVFKVIVLISFIFTSSCNKNTNKSTPVKNLPRAASVKIPNQPIAKKISDFTVFDIPILISSANYYDNKWSSKNWSFLEFLVKKQITNDLETGYLNKAYKLWSNYVSIWRPRKGYKIKHIPSKDTLEFTKNLLDRFLKQGGLEQSFHILFFLNTFGDKQHVKQLDKLIQWIVNIDTIKYRDCLNKKSKLSLCYRDKTGDTLFRTLTEKWPSQLLISTYWKYIKNIFSLAPSTTLKDFNISKIKNLDLVQKNKLLQRVSGLLFYSDQPFKNISIFIKNNKKNLEDSNPFMLDQLNSFVSNKVKASSNDSLLTYFEAKMGTGVSQQICNILTKKYPDNNKISLCRVNSFKFLSDSLMARDLFIKIITKNPMIKEPWEKLFTISFMRFYHFIEREYIGMAKKEADFLGQIYQEAMKYWSKKDFKYDKSTVSVALADLYLIRGKVNLAKQELLKAQKESPSVEAISSLIKIYFWEKNYNKVLDLFKEFMSFKTSSGYDVFRFMKLTPLYAKTLENMDQTRKANIVRRNALQYYMSLFRKHVNNYLRSEILLQAGKIYISQNKTKAAVQLFQYSLSHDPACSSYRTIMQDYVKKSLLTNAIDVYNSYLGQTKCENNRKMYASIWIYQLAKLKKANMEEVENSVEFMSKFNQDKWLKTLGSYVMGKISMNQLMKNADSPGKKVEALYYSGFKAWIKGNTKEAVKLFKLVLKSKIYLYTEYDLSNYFLEHQLKSPQKDAH